MLQITINECGGTLMCLFTHNGVKYQANQDWVGTSIAESSSPFHPVYTERRESRERSVDAMASAIAKFTGMEVTVNE